MANVDKLTRLMDGNYEGIRTGETPLTQTVQDAASYTAQVKDAMRKLRRGQMRIYLVRTRLLKMQSCRIHAERQRDAANL